MDFVHKLNFHTHTHTHIHTHTLLKITVFIHFTNDVHLLVRKKYIHIQTNIPTLIIGGDDKNNNNKIRTEK